MSFELRAGAATRASGTPRSERERWQIEYARRLWVGDLVVVGLAVGAAQVIRFGGPVDPPLASTLPLEVRYTVVSILLGLVWTAFLAVSGARSPRVIGSGTEEYRRLVAATLRLFGMIAMLSLIFRFDIARGYLAIALPLGLAGLMVQRRLWRRWVAGHRLSGRYSVRVLVVGSRGAAAAMVAAFSRDASSGYHVVGICTPDVDAPSLEVDGRTIPVVGDDRSVLDAVRATGADTVAVTATDDLGPADFRHLAWELDPPGVELIVAPGLVDIAGTRLTHRFVADMPMLHVEKPQYDRAKSFGKAVFDLCFAGAAVLAVAPVLVAIAVAVKVTSPGPVFYLSERIGRGGKPFRMIKFRSMYADAEAHVAELIAADGGNPLFFKMREDPRVTPVGRVIRKYSLDELPQFFNVLRGDMSVVGPRPQVRREVDSYDGTMRRRLLVKPGVTGLWQVSGRSDLSIEDAMRLDLSYVENWSMVLDLLLIARTMGAVTRGDGAY
ncbi:sugar transferase [Nocardia mexicana]|uniref:Undecaprenyl-phosphate galactose phosphotransferase WbaP/exopolysaccharide biosynthesis polyprenyl glycosylphosphotransferase n=1 Tax=Nocardia mexicana TaxID=279262 RepID=A0A370HEX6_9NOCA|nr:sugar transferase [Nocardia mexicana]RDI55798.1 Undecaprenyl-phosphate galactose phosphotransferase WbaP/exopolysaccharide biosynthesis polyprenyl glycosylphosphotransferase [Nocardia mexicana]